jgi:hypothetical protein
VAERGGTRELSPIMPLRSGGGSSSSSSRELGPSEPMEEEEEEEEEERRGVVLDRPSTAAAGAAMIGQWQRVAMRCAVVGGALVVAVAVPNLELVIALFGSLNAPLLALILPPVMAMQVLDPPPPRGLGHGCARRHAAMAALGVFGSVLGTLFALREIAAEMFDPDPPV